MHDRRTQLPNHNLDILRSIAVLLVLGDHLGIATLAAHWRHTFAALGRLGVLLFFVHTSLVLMSSLERQGERPDWIRTFYIRRAFRIYPLAMFAVGLVLVLGIPGGIPRLHSVAVFRRPAPATVLANLALVQNVAARPQVLAPLWSLPIEVQMYVMLPLCWVLAKKGTRWLAALLAALLLAFSVVAYAPIPFAWRLTVFLFGPCFFGGVYAYAALRSGTRPRFPAWTLPVVVGACIVWLLAARSTDATPVRNWVPCLLVGAMLPLLVDARESVITHAAKQIATYSYGLYLLHIPALWLAFVVFQDSAPLVRGAVFVVSLVCMSWAAYELIEAPLIRVGQNLVNRPSPEPSVTLSVP